MIKNFKNGTHRFKGYFSTEVLLNAAWPSPVLGDFVWAGSPFPGTVWECTTAGTWTDTSDVPETPGVDLNNWDQIDW